MDLSRWSLKHLGQELNQILGHALDADLPRGPEETNQIGFEISGSSQDLDQELAMIRPGSSVEKLLTAFKPFFEGGACLRVVDDRTFMTSLFLFGQTFTPAEAHGTPVDFGLRAIETSRVYTMNLKPILKALNLGSFVRLEEASVFAFAISRDCIFLLFDNRPHPWQVLAIENAYLSARETYGRITEIRSTTRGLFK